VSIPQSKSAEPFLGGVLRSADFSPQQCPNTTGAVNFPDPQQVRTLLRTEVRAPAASCRRLSSLASEDSSLRT